MAVLVPKQVIVTVDQGVIKIGNDLSGIHHGYINLMADLMLPARQDLLSFYQPSYESPSTSQYILPADKSVPDGRFQTTNNIH